MTKNIVELAFLFAAFSLQAANTAAPDNLYGMSLEELLQVHVVSATRADSKLSESPLPISVITAREIRDSGLDSIPDILNRLPEIDVLHIGRAQPEVSIRGKGINFNRRLLVMIDGRTEYNDLFGVTLWATLPIGVDDIKRIEVVRGPSSALYGANAYSGVINIITKHPHAGEHGGHVRVQAGQQGHRYASMSVAGGGKSSHFRVSAGYTNWGNKTSAVEFPGFNRIPTTDNFNHTTAAIDGITRANAEVILRPSAASDLRLSAGYSDGNLKLLVQPGLPRSDWEVTGSNVQVDYNYRWQTKTFQLKGYFNQFEYDTPLVPTTAAVDALTPADGRYFFPSVDVTKNFSGIVGTYDLSLQLVGSGIDELLKYVVGAEYREINSSGGLVQNSSKSINSAFANMTYKFADNRWQLALGLRADDDQITGVDYGYTASLIWFQNETDSLRATARRAFRAPSLFEQFSQIDLNVPNQNQHVRFRGNPGLAVETINATDLTWSREFSRTLHGEVELYHERYTNIIGNPDSGLLQDVVLDPATNTFTTTTSFQNLANASSKGVQISLVWQAGERTRVTASYRYANPDGLNSVPGETFFTPKDKVNLGANWTPSELWNVTADLVYVGITNPGEFPNGDIAPAGPNFTRDNQRAYTLVNLALHYSPPATKTLKLYFVADNLFDKRHVEYYEFDQVLKATGEQFGREIWGGASWSF